MWGIFQEMVPRRDSGLVVLAAGREGEEWGGLAVCLWLLHEVLPVMPVWRSEGRGNSRGQPWYTKGRGCRLSSDITLEVGVIIESMETKLKVRYPSPKLVGVTGD